VTERTRWYHQLADRLSLEERIDPSRVGISFIDVLFALVVGQTLEPLVAWDILPGVAFAHMGVAFVLTVASWIGYHNSINRPHYVIGFINWPLWQFAVDVALVIVYWLTATYIEGPHPFGAEEVVRLPSLRPEAVLVAVSFVLYFIWDLITWSMRRSPTKYALFSPNNDTPRRRTVTRICLILAAGIAWVAVCGNPRSTFWISFWDGALILLLIGYRIAKEIIGGRAVIPADRTLEDEFQIAMDQLDKVRRKLKERGDSAT
jgi:hypothetical protein